MFSTAAEAALGPHALLVKDRLHLILSNSLHLPEGKKLLNYFFKLLCCRFLIPPLDLLQNLLLSLTGLHRQLDFLTLASPDSALHSTAGRKKVALSLWNHHGLWPR